MQGLFDKIKSAAPGGQKVAPAGTAKKGGKTPPPLKKGGSAKKAVAAPAKKAARKVRCVRGAAAARGLLLLLPCGAPAPPHGSGGAHCGHLLIRSPRPTPPPAAPPPIWRSGTVSERWCNSPTAFLPPVLACPPSREMVAH